MTTEQVRRALVQVLECYHRSGVQRAARNRPADVPEDWFGAVDQLAALQSTDSAVQDPPARPNATVVPTPAGTSVPAAAPTNVRPVELDTTSSSDRWSLPVLPLDERTTTFEALDAEIRACRQCANIVDFRQQTVFGAGNPNAKICFMGEAPGADEDRQGVPFVGRAGQLLTKIIEAMKLSREEVFILNALKCRPPQNRTPVPDEIQACRSFVQRQLEVIQPQYIVCLGAVAVRSLLQSDQSIGRQRGRFYQYRGAKVVVTYHPSYLLRNESAKRFVWEDMKMLMRDMGTLE